VAILVAQAKSNDEIAAELVISKRTVETHVSNIRSKLAFSKRTQIVRWALEAGLVEASQSERQARMTAKPTSENVESL